MIYLLIKVIFKAVYQVFLIKAPSLHFFSQILQKLQLIFEVIHLVCLVLYQHVYTHYL